MKKLSYLLVFMLLGQLAFAQSKLDFAPLQQLLKRQIPWLAGKVVFTTIQQENGYDVFEIKTVNDKLMVAATSKPAAGEAINWYLKYYCNQLLSRNNSNMVALQTLPLIEKPERHVSWAKYRFSNNYCVFNYTMSFWTWKEWERELDWMALNGINLSLTIVGVEEVWHNVLKQLNFSETEIDEFIAGPAYTAWWLMGNLEGWGGPVPASMRKQQVALQKQILKRMKELGIEPELHGFYGMVPRKLKQKYPDANIIEQGKWAGGFDRPSILLPTDPLFQKIGSLYYNEIKKLYGKDIKYFGGDPFHEGGKTAGIDLASIGKNIQQLMQQHFPRSAWLLMGWGANPSNALLADLNSNYTIIQELFGENRAEWENRKGFNGYPYIWNVVSNFGGKEGMYGRLERMMKEPRRAAFGQYGNSFAGVGTMPEGNADNPVVFDLIYSLPWMQGEEDISTYIKNYPVYRYGKYNEEAEKAWQLYLKTTYASSLTSREGATESLFCARPAFDISSVSTWGNRKIEYDPALLEKAVLDLLGAANDFAGQASYRYDLVDGIRQVIANKGQLFHQKMKLAFEAKDKAGFQKASETFLELVLLQDSLLKCDKRFMLSTWLNDARNFGSDERSKDLSEKNARWLITIWGPDDSSTNLHEYSHREWQGLLSTLYYKRWKAFVDYHQAVLNNTAPARRPDFFSMERDWANTTGDGLYPNAVINDYIPLATKILNRVIEMN